MIITKRACPDCRATGIDPTRGGLCSRCHGSTKSAPTHAEELHAIAMNLVCVCKGGTGSCNAGC